VRLIASCCLLAAGLIGWTLAVVVQSAPSYAAWFLPAGVDAALLRTFVVADVVLLGALPICAARGLVTGRAWGYAALCAYLGAMGYATLWAWTSVVATRADATGALLLSPGALVALWSAVVLRPGAAAAAFPRAAERTTPPQRLVVLFDGHCRFCRAGVRARGARVAEGVIEAPDQNDP
jgi:hypothetical protein